MTRRKKIWLCVLAGLMLVVMVGVSTFRYVPYKNRPTPYAIPAELKEKVWQETEDISA